MPSTFAERDQLALTASTAWYHVAECGEMAVKGLKIRCSAELRSHVRKHFHTRELVTVPEDLL
jgi:hypothetical protein